MLCNNNNQNSIIIRAQFSSWEKKLQNSCPLAWTKSMTCAWLHSKHKIVYFFAIYIYQYIYTDCLGRGDVAWKAKQSPELRKVDMIIPALRKEKAERSDIPSHPSLHNKFKLFVCLVWFLNICHVPDIVTMISKTHGSCLPNLERAARCGVTFL